MLSRTRRSIHEDRPARRKNSRAPDENALDVDRRGKSDTIGNHAAFDKTTSSLGFPIGTFRRFADPRAWNGWRARPIMLK
jgi:hypothetical protein